ncbi:MAG: hypothetical protein QME96_04485 [Myxococcota bacterium]|nr:hypothetical protein [Myxococcota bacterium]
MALRLCACLALPACAMDWTLRSSDGDIGGDVGEDVELDVDGDAVSSDADDGGDADVPAEAGPSAPVRWFNTAGGVSTNSEYRLEGTLGGPPGPGVSSNSEYKIESGGMRLTRGR